MRLLIGNKLFKAKWAVAIATEGKSDSMSIRARNLLNLLGVANPDVMPVEVKTPKSIDEAGTNNQSKQNNGYVQLSLPLSNIV